MAERFNITYQYGYYSVSIPNYDGGEVVDAESFDALAKALQDIAAIENQEFGPDWAEIERARKIANDALTAAGVGGAGQ